MAFAPASSLITDYLQTLITLNYNANLERESLATVIYSIPAGSRPTAGHWRCPSGSLWLQVGPDPSQADTGGPCRSCLTYTLQAPP